MGRSRRFLVTIDGKDLVDLERKKGDLGTPWSTTIAIVFRRGLVCENGHHLERTKE